MRTLVHTRVGDDFPVSGDATLVSCYPLRGAVIGGRVNGASFELSVSLLGRGGLKPGLYVLAGYKPGDEWHPRIWGTVVILPTIEVRDFSGETNQLNSE